MTQCIHEHPEYAAKSRLSMLEFGNWIEGQLRAHPAYRKRAASDANDQIMRLWDVAQSCPDTAGFLNAACLGDVSADHLHALYRQYQQANVLHLNAGRPHRNFVSWLATMASLYNLVHLAQRNFETIRPRQANP